MSKPSSEYTFTEFENRWQQFWDKNETFKAPNFADKPKYYLLDMFPYPSGAGLHAGHVENFAGSDIIGRYKLARGFNVLHPMGWDAFGLPAEQYAVKTGTHPSITTKTNIENFRRQIKAIGLAIDWSREVNTTDPHYFRWTQWIFINLFKKGLAYVDERPVNWCPALGTVLANEEVVNGKSEVGGHPIERRNLRQWVLRITAYADKLIEGLDNVEWPDSTKAMQRNWIGKSTGAEVSFDLDGFDEKLKIYTTRPDTLFGATYMVIAPEHPLVGKLTLPENEKAVAEYIASAASKSDLDRTELNKNKSGVFTGSYAINPVNGKRIPVWIADYVLMSYGTGAIMAVPAHDERDFEFAEKFDLPIVRVIDKKDADGNEIPLPFTDVGLMTNSGDLDGISSDEGKSAIIARLEAEKRGNAAINFKLRDWLFSRQRYWGEPFPIVWLSREDYEKLRSSDGAVAQWLPEEPVTFVDEKGETHFAVAIPESQLPVTLPELQNYEPAGTGESPLAKAEGWVNVWLDPISGSTTSADAEKPSPDAVRGSRETNTMPQWAGSCWYYLRYLDPHNPDALVDPEIRDYWGSPDFYMGGAEHAVLHLLYARFWHQFLADIGVLKEAEPFRKLFHQGIILGEDGEKMSKSRGNVVNPDDFIRTHGSDSLRAFLMFMGPLEDKKPWNSQGIEGVFRFLKKVWREYIGPEGELSSKISSQPDSPEIKRALHETIKKVTEDMEQIRFNTAISQMMIFINQLNKADHFNFESAKDFIRLLAPIAPHIAEEIWARLGQPPSIVHAGWPTFDPAVLASDEVKIGLLVNGKPRAEITIPKDMAQDDVFALAKEQERFSAHVEGKQVVKVIYVPGKILNVVVRG